LAALEDLDAQAAAERAQHDMMRARMLAELRALSEKRAAAAAARRK
jgi:hypothetical protein